MANSRKVALTILVTLLIAAAVITSNVVLIHTYSQANNESYLAAIIDKNRLLEETVSPKIIIIGGSNAAFGFDSATISQATGMPVVNMGLQGSLGLRWPLNNIKPNIHKGDIILLSPEYHNLLDHLQGGDILAQLLVFYPHGVTSLTSPNDIFQVLQSLPNIHTRAVKNIIELMLRDKCDFLCQNDEYVYFRRAFNPANGDIMTNQVKDSNKESDFLFSLVWSIPNHDLQNNVRFLNNFNDYIESQEASMYYILPSISDNFSSSTGETLQSAAEYLQEHLTFPILGSLSDSFFQHQYLFDTPYHLNSDGRALRTQMVIDDLCTVIECSYAQ